jgi:hypothetical protein
VAVCNIEKVAGIGLHRCSQFASKPALGFAGLHRVFPFGDNLVDVAAQLALKVRMWKPKWLGVICASIVTLLQTGHSGRKDMIARLAQAGAQHSQSPVDAITGR